MEQWNNRGIAEAKCSIVVRQGFDGELTVEPLTTPRKIEGRSNVLLLHCQRLKWV
jgi:hypothetical protein